MKIIDWLKKGNLVRFYLGDESDNEYWGDDWNDKPYEHNSGSVYEEYVKGYVDVLFPFDWDVAEACEDYPAYSGNSPYSKEMFKERKVPFLVAVPHDNEESYWFDRTYTNILADGNSVHFFFNDIIDDSLNHKTIMYDWHNKLSPVNHSERMSEIGDKKTDK